ncbi:MAG TPA: serine/threonine-protein kinase, partial [Myxococcales bacterium]|nr:serine/threonine-protein kinase [Myxococcales bacterium]
MLLLGRYQLIREIGRGGMAEVWEARALGDRGFTRRVAVKRLTASGSEMERMFVDEARIASRLHHANVVPVLDFGVAEGVPFQVLEYVDGLDADALQALARARASGIPVACALHVAAEVARGLDHAHQARGDDGELLGIVHRDVSPNNILVAWTGEVKLSDFGIAFARDRGAATEAGTTKGKPCYMAPEQITRGTLDPRTDLFALGCVLHALVAGESPMAGEDRMADLLAGKPLPLAAELPDDVRAIVARATRRSRSERYEDARSIAAACDEAAHARAGGDPRRAFLQWLGTLRPAPAPAAGALDWMFGATPVPGGAPAAALAHAPTAVVTPVPPAAARPRGGKARILVAAAVLLAFAGGGAALMARPEKEAPLESLGAVALETLPAAPIPSASAPSSLPSSPPPSSSSSPPSSPSPPASPLAVGAASPAVAGPTPPPKRP